MATKRSPKPPTEPDDATEGRVLKLKPRRKRPDEPREIVRRKPVRKDQHIIIRVTAEQKAILRFAADKAGEGLSGWILSTAMRAAAKQE